MRKLGFVFFDYVLVSFIVSGYSSFVFMCLVVREVIVKK